MQTTAPNAEYYDANRQPTHFVACFTTNGASNPTLFGGHVESVELKATAAPRPFWRIRFKETIPNLSSRRTGITTGLEAAENVDGTVKFSTAGYTANPADAIEAGREIDVQLMEAGTAVNTAGRTIRIHILIDQSEG
jgi:hypothetical protein